MPAWVKEEQATNPCIGPNVSLVCKILLAVDFLDAIPSWYIFCYLLAIAAAAATARDKV